MTMKHTKQSIISKDGVSYLIPFILITSCFALWGFANDITNPMVKAFSKIFRMSATDGALVQVAFYGGYFAMAFPAAIFIRKYSYKAGVLLGLGMYAFGWGGAGRSTAEGRAFHRRDRPTAAVLSGGHALLLGGLRGQRHGGAV